MSRDTEAQILKLVEAALRDRGLNVDADSIRVGAWGAHSMVLLWVGAKKVDRSAESVTQVVNEIVEEILEVSFVKQSFVKRRDAAPPAPPVLPETPREIKQDAIRTAFSHLGFSNDEIARIVDRWSAHDREE